MARDLHDVVAAHSVGRRHPHRGHARVARHVAGPGHAADRAGRSPGGAGGDAVHDPRAARTTRPRHRPRRPRPSGRARRRRTVGRAGGRRRRLIPGAAGPPRRTRPRSASCRSRSPTPPGTPPAHPSRSPSADGSGVEVVVTNPARDGLPCRPSEHRDRAAHHARAGRGPRRDARRRALPTAGGSCGPRSRGSPHDRRRPGARRRRPWRDPRRAAPPCSTAPTGSPWSGRPPTEPPPSRTPEPCGPTSCSWTSGCPARTASRPPAPSSPRGLADVLALTTFDLDEYASAACWPPAPSASC